MATPPVSLSTHHLLHLWSTSPPLNPHLPPEILTAGHHPSFHQCQRPQAPTTLSSSSLSRRSCPPMLSSPHGHLPSPSSPANHSKPVTTTAALSSTPGHHPHPPALSTVSFTSGRNRAASQLSASHRRRLVTPWTHPPEALMLGPDAHRHHLPQAPCHRHLIPHLPTATSLHTPATPTVRAISHGPRASAPVSSWPPHPSRRHTSMIGQIIARTSTPSPSVSTCASSTSSPCSQPDNHQHRRPLLLLPYHHTQLSHLLRQTGSPPPSDPTARIIHSEFGRAPASFFDAKSFPAIRLRSWHALL